MQHLQGKIHAHHHSLGTEAAVDFQSHVGGAAGHIQQAGPRRQGQGIGQEAAPLDIPAQAQQSIQKIVMRRDAIEHLADEGKFR